MTEIRMNVIPFKGKPFKDPISLWFFNAKQNLNWNDIGWVVRQIRLRLRGSECLVFQYGRKIVSTRDLSQNIELSDLINQFDSSENVEVSIEDETGLEIIRRLIGEAISHRLRNDMRNAYKVTEQANAVYYASDPTEIVGFGELEVYNGFTFVPLIQKEGQVGVMIDPRSRYHTKNTIREFLNANNQEVWIKELDFDHVDICPVHWCEEKKDPLSSCLHSGPGRGIKIVDFISDLPTKTGRIDDEKKIDLIKYHKSDKVCPRGHLDNRFIKNEPPVSISDFGYPFPLERIRRSPRTYLLRNPKDRRLLHTIVSLDSHRRYSKTFSYAKLIQEIDIDDILQLISMNELLTSEIKDSFSAHSGKISGPKLSIAKGKRKTYYPNIELAKYGPYIQPDKISSLKVIIITIGFQEKRENFITFASSVIKGTTDSEIINNVSLSSILKKNVEVISTIDISAGNSEDIDSKFLEIHNLASKYRDEILFFLAIGERSQGLTSKVKKFLIENDMPNQGFNISRFMEKFEFVEKSYFFNIFLGAFCKVGGVPWVVDFSSEDTIFIGYDVIFRDESAKYSLTLYDSQGIWCKGLITITNKKNFEEYFERDIESLIEDREENNIRFYSTGGMYTILEFDVIKKKLKETKKNYSIFEILHNPVRIYTISEKGSFSAGRGSYVEFLPDNIALVTTIPPGRQGTPQPILIRMKSGNPSLIRKYLKEIFYLTYYAGYGRMIIRYPSPIHAARQIIRNIKSLNLDKSFQFENPWFI